jgi:hypothetical protein
MATKFVTNLDLNGNQILNGRLQAVSADPTIGNFEGRLIYRTDLDCIKYHDGANWQTLLKGVVAAGDHSASLTISETGGAISITPNLASALQAGLLSTGFFNDLNNATSSSTGGTLAKRDANGRIQVAAPSNDLDAANKGYVDAARQGLDVKASVRLATNAVLPAYAYDAGTITASESGVLLVDGVQPSIGERILVKNEIGANEPYNGIYNVVDFGNGGPFILTRSEDADTNVKVTPGMFTFVEEGNTWGDSGWLLTNDTIPIILGTSPLTFVQFSAAGQTIAGNGLVKIGNAIDVVGTADRIVANVDSIDIAATYVGQTSITTVGTITTGVWNGTDVAVADGGTGASTAGNARTNLAVGGTQGVGVSVPVLVRKVALTIGNGTLVDYTVQHGLDTTDVVVEVYEVSTGETVIADVVRTDANNVRVTFSSPPALGAFKVVVTG